LLPSVDGESGPSDAGVTGVDTQEGGDGPAGSVGEGADESDPEALAAGGDGDGDGFVMLGLEDTNSEKIATDTPHILQPPPKPSSSVTASPSFFTLTKRKLDDDDNSSMASARAPSSTRTVDSSTSSAKRRLTAPVALNRVGDQLSNMNDTLQRSTLALSTRFDGLGVQPPPARKSAASESALLAEDDLDTDELVMLMDIFQADVATADSYLVLYKAGEKRAAVRKAWVRKRLDERRLPTL
ncbi:hypothetical protein BV22DRAFT_1135758, partial [Leucogyrophana mollusca]